MAIKKPRQQKQPKQPKVAAPEGEIATARVNPFEPIFNNTLRPKDATLASRGAGRGIWIYDEIERDCHAFAVIQKRKFALVGRDWHIDAASDDPADQRAADRVRDALNGIQFDRACVDLLDAILKGYSVGEIMWGVKGDMVVPLDILARDQRRFVFDVQGRPRLLCWANLITGIDLPDRKFIVHRFGAKDGNPYGLGLGTRLFWPVWFKRQGLQFWLTFADKFGNPTPIGKYPPGASPDQKDALLNILQAISNDTGIALPEGLSIDLLEAKRSGGANGIYDSLLKYLDDEVEKTVLGSTQTTSSRSGGLGSQVSAIQNEVRLELVRADGGMLAATLNDTLIRWLVEMNDPGANPPRIYWDVEESEDLKLRADRDLELAQMGFKLTEDAVREVYGDFYERGTPLPAKGASSFAEGNAGPDAPSQMVHLLDRSTAAPIDGWIGKIRQAAAEASSLEDLRDRVTSLFPAMSLTQYADAMTLALTAAQLAGRTEIMDEARAGS